MIKHLKKKFKIIFGERIKLKIVNVLRENQNEYINKYPNLATFSFDRIGTEIFVYGIYEKEILETLEECIFNKIDTKNSFCLDIGANIGNHTLYFADFFKQVYSFEPHPEIFELLKFNVRKSKNIKVFPFGLSNKNDEMIIATDQNTFYGRSSLRNTKKLNSIKKGFHQFNVQVKKFDDFTDNINAENNIVFIKLDVEGHELNVLQGMKKTLKQNSPIICFEQDISQFDDFDQNISSPVINFFKDNGYFCFYEVLYVRKWRFSNTKYSFVKNIIKLFEVILFGMPEISKQLLRINEFSKKNYYAIITSKTPLKS